MNAMIRSLKGLVALGALAGLGLGLRWMTAGAVGVATSADLTSMASLAIGAVGWVAYGWLLIAVLATVLEQAPGAVGRAASGVICWTTSQGSRALLRSALGVAAATPLTIGVAHAAPGDGTPQRSVQRTWTAVEKASSIRLANTPDLWRATEKASTVQLTGQSQVATRSLQALHEFGAAYEQDSPAGIDQCVSEPADQVALAHARRAEQKHAGAAIEPLMASGQRHHLGLGHAGHGGEVEAR